MATILTPATIRGYARVLGGYTLPNAPRGLDLVSNAIRKRYRPVHTTHCFHKGNKWSGIRVKIYATTFDFATPVWTQV